MYIPLITRSPSPTAHISGREQQRDLDTNTGSDLSISATNATTSQGTSPDNNPFYITFNSELEVRVQAYANGGGTWGPTVTDWVYIPIMDLESTPVPQTRWAGGGTRSQVFGTREYGSGYTTYQRGRGVSSRGFPFYFWPVVWPSPDNIANSTDTAYLYSAAEYGTSVDQSRPGGPLTTAVFTPLNLSFIAENTFRIIADNATVISLVDNIFHNCSAYLDLSSGTQRPVPFDLQAPLATPDQAVQYYRASSIVLLLDGYSNSATFAPPGTPNSMLPLGVNLSLMACLNATIGAAAPLFSEEPVNGPLITWVFLGIVGFIVLLITSSVLCCESEDAE